MDRVDVALATYNGTTYLPAFLQSVEAQGYPSIRLVASDDTSGDGTADLTRAFRPDSTVQLINTGARGFRGNFANAIAACDAPYVALADQDDVWLPEKIETLVARMKALEARIGAGTPAIVCSDLAVVDEALRPLRDSFFARWEDPVRSLDFADLTLGNRVPGCCMLINRALIDRAMPLPETIRFHDWWFMLVAAAFGAFDVVETPLILYRQHGGNQVGDMHRKLSLWERIAVKVRGPIAHMRSRAELFRHIALDPVATLEAFQRRFGAALSSGDAHVLAAATSPGLSRKLWRYRRARAPFGRVFKLMMLYFMDEAERRAAGTRA